MSGLGSDNFRDLDTAPAEEYDLGIIAKFRDIPAEVEDTIVRCGIGCDEEQKVSLILP